MEDYSAQFTGPSGNEDLEKLSKKKKKGFFGNLFKKKVDLPPPPPQAPQTPQTQDTASNDEELEKLKSKLGIKSYIDPDKKEKENKEMLNTILNRIEDINKEDKIELEEIQEEEKPEPIKEPEPIKKEVKKENDLPELPPDIDFDNVETPAYEDLKIELKHSAQPLKKADLKAALTPPEHKIAKLQKEFQDHPHKTVHHKKKKPKVHEKVQKHEEFIRNDGLSITSLPDLVIQLAKMPEKTYKYHVNKEKNDFAKWINDILLNEELAKKIKRYQSKERIISIIEKYIETEEKLAEKQRKQEKEKKTLEEELKELKAKRAQIQKELKKEKENIITHKQDILKQYIDLKNNTTKYKLDMKKELEHIETKKHLTQKETTTLAQKKKNLEKDMKNLQNNIKALQKEFTEEEQQHNQVLKQTQNKLKNTQEAIEKNRHIIDTQEKITDTLKKTITKLEHKKTNLNKAIQKTELQVQDALQKVRSLETKLKTRQQEIDDAEEALKEKHTHLLHLKHELEKKGYQAMLNDTLSESNNITSHSLVDPEDKLENKEITKLQTKIEECNKLAALREWQKAQILYNEIRQEFYKQNFTTKEARTRIYNKIRLLYDEIHLAMIGQKSLL